MRDLQRRGIQGGSIVVCLAAACAVLIWAPAGANRSPTQSSPPDPDALARLPLPAHASISRVVGRDDPAYHARPVGGAVTVENARHGLAARFTRTGMQLRAGSDRVGLALEAYGYGEALAPVRAAAPRWEGNQIEYRRGPLLEWFVNGPLGLEQGFTLSRPPPTTRSGPLTVALALTGTLVPSLEHGGKGLRLGRSSLGYRGLIALDARGRELPATLRLRGRSVLLQVDDEGASYPVTIDPFIERGKLTASDRAFSDQLGFSVAASGDTVVAGAYQKAGGRGAVYVFVKPPSGWASATEAGKLTASDGAVGDQLGYSVAVSDSTIIAGAPGDDGVKGAAYVFVKPAAGWASGTETAKLTASDGSANDMLGRSVAVSGDTALAGAPDDNTARGSVYVFAKPPAGWTSATETAKLTASDGNVDDHLGTSVATSGDAIAAGAPGKASSRGALYVFVKPGAAWATATETAKLTASDGVAGDTLGLVDLAGDTLVGGAPGDDGITGSAYVFVKPVTGWASTTQTAKLTASDRAGNDLFGRAVATSGETVVVGARGDDSFKGSVYVFTRPGGGWQTATETEKLTASDGAAGDRFGNAVAVAGSSLVASAPDDDSGTGSAYVFDTPGLSWTVNTTADTDDGACTTIHCSLREAIIRSNTQAGADTIDFEIPGSTPHSIGLSTALPPITDPVTIDGATQSGFAGSPVVEIDGSTIRCGPGNLRTQCGASGFYVEAGNSTIRGLAINGFATGAIKACVGSPDCADTPFPGGHAIYLTSGPGSPGFGNVVEGNYVGTDVTGTVAKPNQGSGIVVSTSSNRIGGTGPGQGNIVSASGTAPYLVGGIELRSGSGNVVQGNRIGTGPAGSEVLGNASAGVLVTSATDMFDTAIETNAIANNVTGIVVVGSGPQRTRISANEIYDNAQLGIDLGSDGVTPNDDADPDTGPNGLQNFPELATAVSGGGQTQVSGSLDTADGGYRVELFSSPACDSSGNGEGRRYLGFETVSVSGGAAVFTATLAVDVTVGHVVTATAISSDGNTSELSPCVTVAEEAGVIIPTLDPPLPPEPGVWSWGNGAYGQLGSGSSASRHTPRAVVGVDDAAALTASAHGLALRADGELRSWGLNPSGELGVAPSATACNPYGSSSAYTYTYPCRETGAPVPGLSNIVATDAGSGYTLALDADGRVWSWGSNYYGTLGVSPADTSCTFSVTSGTTTSSYTNACRPTPTQISGLTDIVAIAAGEAHALALDGDGNVYSWGSNYYGELGVDSSTTTCTGSQTYESITYTYTLKCRPQPAQVAGLSGIVAIAAGAFSSFAVDAAGNVYSWGLNNSGQLGAEPSTTSCDVTYESGTYAWTQTYPCRPAPEQIAGVSGVTRISTGWSHALALTGDGNVYGWGANYYGQLGAEPSSTSCTVTYGYSSATGGSSTYSYTQMCRGTPARVGGLDGVVAVAAGASHNLALDGSGDVYAWGSNWSGELGEEPSRTSCEVAWSYGSVTYTYTQMGCRATPERVEGLTQASAIAAGQSTSFAAGTASPNYGVESFTISVPAGARVTSDVEQDGATVDDPVEVEIESPNGGEVSVSKSSERSWVGDFSVQGRTIEIEAPNASSADDPIVLRFVVDVSLFPAWYDVAWLSVYRNGAWVESCTGAGASPDPCIASRTRLPDGDVELVVLTTDASEWTLGVTGPTADAGGPYLVDEGTTVELTAAGTSGGRAPLAYRWSPLAGLDDIGSATPSFDAVDNGVFPVELSVVDGIGLSSRDVAEVVVANVAPTATLETNATVEVGAAIQLSLTNPQDPSPVDTAAGFEYAFDCGDGSGFGLFGSASTAACPTSTVGTRTVKAKIRDKDGGVTQRQATVKVVYPFSGFFAPVDNPPIVNGAKAGTAIPVKFSLNGNRGTAIFATGYPVSRRVDCDGGAPLDAIEEVSAPGSSGLSYDALADRYTYVWRTEKSWRNTCRELVIRLVDGTDHVALFRLT